LLLGLVALTLPAPAPAADHPPISLHPDNGHYFLFRSKPTVLVASGEHYGAVLNGDFDYVRYFDELKRNELNLTRTFSGVYREVPGSFNIKNNDELQALIVRDLKQAESFGQLYDLSQPHAI
ncbi:MAG: hypothetical protein IAF58_05630, partial [Leptolyngbya sp.]|nr:hypothetical protein [Candidatus Melainabacteria bacterium]